MKTALIFGISGQDGAYLANFLLKKGYKVIGASRDAENNPFTNLHSLKIFNNVELTSVSLKDFSSIFSALKKFKPDEIYNLSGQSSVGYSYHHPVETIESIFIGTSNLLEAIRLIENPMKFYNAGSGECFGDTHGQLAKEFTILNPRSPYAVSKCSTYWLVKNYRESYGLHCSTGHLFNHESPLRGSRFVTKKIIDYVIKVKSDPISLLKIGNLEIKRDWGWAPEYVEAMWKMLQVNVADDFIIATSEVHSLKDFLETAFSLKGLSYQNYVTVDENLMRPNDILFGGGDASKAKEILGWEARTKFKDVIQKMLFNEMY